MPQQEAPSAGLNSGRGASNNNNNTRGDPYRARRLQYLGQQDIVLRQRALMMQYDRLQRYRQSGVTTNTSPSSVRESPQSTTSRQQHYQHQPDQHQTTTMMMNPREINRHSPTAYIASGAHADSDSDQEQLHHPQQSRHRHHRRHRQSVNQMRHSNSGSRSRASNNNNSAPSGNSHLGARIPTQQHSDIPPVPSEQLDNYEYHASNAVILPEVQPRRSLQRRSKHTTHSSVNPADCAGCLNNQSHNCTSNINTTTELLQSNSLQGNAGRQRAIESIACSCGSVIPSSEDTNYQYVRTCQGLCGDEENRISEGPNSNEILNSTGKERKSNRVCSPERLSDVMNTEDSYGNLVSIGDCVSSALAADPTIVGPHNLYQDMPAPDYHDDHISSQYQMLEINSNMTAGNEFNNDVDNAVATILEEAEESEVAINTVDGDTQIGMKHTSSNAHCFNEELLMTDNNRGDPIYTASVDPPLDLRSLSLATHNNSLLATEENSAVATDTKNSLSSSSPNSPSTTKKKQEGHVNTSSGSAKSHLLRTTERTASKSPYSAELEHANDVLQQSITDEVCLPATEQTSDSVVETEPLLREDQRNDGHMEIVTSDVCVLRGRPLEDVGESSSSSGNSAFDGDVMSDDELNDEEVALALQAAEVAAAWRVRAR